MQTLIEILCANNTSKFRCIVSMISRDWNRIAIAVTCNFNPSLRKLLTGECDKCEQVNIKAKRTPKRCCGTYRRPQHISRGITICYHSMILLKSRKLMRPAFLANCNDYDAIMFAVNFRLYRLYLPDNMRVYRGGLPTSVSSVYSLLDVAVYRENIPAVEYILDNSLHICVYDMQVIDISTMISVHVREHYDISPLWNDQYVHIRRKYPRIYTLLYSHVDIARVIYEYIGAPGRAAACSVSKKFNELMVDASVVLSGSLSTPSLNTHVDIRKLYTAKPQPMTHYEITAIFRDYHLFVRTKDTFGYSMQAICAIACEDVSMHIISVDGKSENALFGAFRSTNLNLIRHLLECTGSEYITGNILGSIKRAWRDPYTSDNAPDALDIYADYINADVALLRTFCESGELSIVKHMHKRIGELPVDALSVPHPITFSPRLNKLPTLDYILSYVRIHNDTIQRLIKCCNTPDELVYTVSVLDKHSIKYNDELVTKIAVERGASTIVAKYPATQSLVKCAIKHQNTVVLTILLSKLKPNIAELNEFAAYACISWEHIPSFHILVEHGANYCRCDYPITDHK